MPTVATKTTNSNELLNLFYAITTQQQKDLEKEIKMLLLENQTKNENDNKNSKRFSGAISIKTAEKLHKHINEARNEWEKDNKSL